jgi:hypothetical protein
MPKQRHIAAVIGMVIFGCGVAANQSIKQTLMGVPRDQVLVDAQHVLAVEGFDVEEVDLDKGEIKSSWRKKMRHQVQYVINVKNTGGGAPAAAALADAGPPLEVPEIVEIVVQANTREKTVSGWTEASPSTSAKASHLLEDIVELAVDRFGKGIGAVPKKQEVKEEEKDTALELKCKATEECPAGMHCGTGHCVSECAMDSDCEAGYGCDERGRCFLKPEPCPAPEAISTDTDEPVEGGEAADRERKKAEEEKDRREHRKSRKERESDVE